MRSLLEVLERDLGEVSGSRWPQSSEPERRVAARGPEHRGVLARREAALGAAERHDHGQLRLARSRVEDPTSPLSLTGTRVMPGARTTVEAQRCRGRFRLLRWHDMERVLVGGGDRLRRLRTAGEASASAPVYERARQRGSVVDRPAASRRAPPRRGSRRRRLRRRGRVISSPGSRPSIRTTNASPLHARHRGVALGKRDVDLAPHRRGRIDGGGVAAGGCAAPSVDDRRSLESAARAAGAGRRAT